MLSLTLQVRPVSRVAAVALGPISRSPQVHVREMNSQGYRTAQTRLGPSCAGPSSPLSRDPEIHTRQSPGCSLHACSILALISSDKGASPAFCSSMVNPTAWQFYRKRTAHFVPLKSAHQAVCGDAVKSPLIVNPPATWGNSRAMTSTTDVFLTTWPSVTSTFFMH